MVSASPASPTHSARRRGLRIRTGLYHLRCHRGEVLDVQGRDYRRTDSPGFAAQRSGAATPTAQGSPRAPATFSAPSAANPAGRTGRWSGAIHSLGFVIETQPDRSPAGSSPTVLETRNEARNRAA